MGRAYSRHSFSGYFWKQQYLLMREMKLEKKQTICQRMNGVEPLLRGYKLFTECFGHSVFAAHIVNPINSYLHISPISAFWGGHFDKHWIFSKCSYVIF